MKLDRNINEDGIGKYALLNLRKLQYLKNAGSTYSEKYANDYNTIINAISLLEEYNIIEWGIDGEEDEFFVLKLKDKFTARALYAYASEASNYDLEYAKEVNNLAYKAEISKYKKLPD